jgi:hypothetical protein
MDKMQFEIPTLDHSAVAPVGPVHRLPSRLPVEPKS